MDTEREKIICNAEQAYKKGEVTAEELLWMRIYTKKDLLLADDLFHDEVMVMPCREERE